MQRSKAQGLAVGGLLSLFCFAVFVLWLSCFPELRLFRAVVDLLVVGSTRLSTRVFVQVVEHLAQDSLEGAESCADCRCAEPVSDQTVRRHKKDKSVWSRSNIIKINPELRYSERLLPSLPSFSSLFIIGFLILPKVSSDRITYLRAVFKCDLLNTVSEITLQHLIGFRPELRQVETFLNTEGAETSICY